MNDNIEKSREDTYDSTKYSFPLFSLLRNRGKRNPDESSVTSQCNFLLKHLSMFYIQPKAVEVLCSCVVGTAKSTCECVKSSCNDV